MSRHIYIILRYIEGFIILYQILCTLIKNGFAKNVYNNIHCRTLSGPLSHFASEHYIQHLSNKKT